MAQNYRQLVYLALAACIATAVYCQPSSLPLDQIRLPPGFTISLYSSQSVQNPRSLALGGTATQPIVYASSNAGVISAIVDRNNTGNQTVCTLISKLDNPEGMVYINGSLYIGEVTRITRYDNADKAVLNNCQGIGDPVVIASPFPETQDHNARHIEVGPDNKLYITYGSPANVDLCEAYGPINACSIVRMNLDGTGLENYAVGVRNSVGFTWHPDTNQFFFSEIERDLLGDNRPDDLLFLGRGAGTNYSWPYCHREGLGDPYLRSPGPGVAFADPDVSNLNQTQIIRSNPTDLNASLNAYCNASSIAPLQAYGPHVAALGLKFYTGSQFPAYYNRTLFVPQHGSWNRALLIGYRVAVLKLDENYNVVNHTIFAEGWLQNQNTTNQSVWGKPVATLQLPDGSLLLSDDKANVVYKITYQPSSPAQSPAITATG